MAEGLITLGVSVVQIFASIFANILVDNVRTRAANNIKSKVVHAEQLRRVVQTDIDEVKEKINSMAQSKILAAYDYVKRALILLQVVCPSDGVQVDLCSASFDDQQMKERVGGAMRDAERLLTQADAWATDAFNDKANVPAAMRLECVRVQLFCALLLHWRRADLWLPLWRNALANMMRDRTVVHSVLSFNPWMTRAQKAQLRATLVSVVNEAVCSLWKVAHNDVAVADDASALLNFIRAPDKVLHEKHHEQWRKAVGLPLNSFCTWQDRLVVVIPECYRLCPASDNALAVIDRQFKIKIVDAVTLQVLKLSKDPFGAAGDLCDKEFGCVSFDARNGLILAAQFRPNELRVLKFDDAAKQLAVVDTVPFPEPTYSVKCTRFDGKWVARSASGNVYCLDRLADECDDNGNRRWVALAKSVKKVFDVADQEKRTLHTTDDDLAKKYFTSFGLALLADCRISTFYRNYPTAPDSSEPFVLRDSKTVDLKTICFYGQNEQATHSHAEGFCQNVLLFEPSAAAAAAAGNILILAQKRADGRLAMGRVHVAKVCTGSHPDDASSSSPNCSSVEHYQTLPYCLDESIEDLMIMQTASSRADDCIYVATGKALRYCTSSLPSKHIELRATLRKLSIRMRPKSMHR